MEEIDDNKRYRNFMILLYPDSESYNCEDVHFYLKGNFKNYAWILHFPESDEKKAHEHWLICLDNPTHLDTFARKIGVPVKFVQPVKSLRASARYLTHIDYEEKTLYSLLDVDCSNSFQQRFLSCYDDLKSDSDVLNDIYQFIEDFKDLSPIDIEIELSKFVVNSGYDRIFKRYYNTIVKVIVHKSTY